MAAQVNMIAVELGDTTLLADLCKAGMSKLINSTYIV